MAVDTGGFSTRLGSYIFFRIDVTKTVMYLEFQNQFTQPSEKEEAPKTSTASLLLGTYNEVCAVFFMVHSFKYWPELSFTFLLTMLQDHTLHLL